MPRQHVSVGVPMLFMFVAILFVIVGFITLFANAAAGFSLIILGLVVGGINRFVFQMRTKQLEIDAHEAIVNQTVNFCPRCGAQIPRNARFCANCGSPIN
jgi:ribosomal protein S27AE